MAAQAKTINLLLYDGSLEGVVSIEDSGWNSGEMYLAPRDAVRELLATDACSKYGVYLLLSDDQVYVGQASDLSRRITQHLSGKDWWERVVVLTTTDDSLDHADIDYLERSLISRALESDSMACENRQKGNPLKVGRFREVFLGQYLEEALFVMRLVGISALSGGTSRRAVSVRAGSIRPVRGERLTKSAALEYLGGQGIDVGASNDCTFATLASSGDHFWANPRTRLLGRDWRIVLNDYRRFELTALFVPAGTLDVRGEGRGGLVCRHDKPDLVNLRIASDTLRDAASGTDFSRFVVARVAY